VQDEKTSQIGKVYRGRGGWEKGGRKKTEDGLSQRQTNEKKRLLNKKTSRKDGKRRESGGTRMESKRKETTDARRGVGVGRITDEHRERGDKGGKQLEGVGALRIDGRGSQVKKADKASQQDKSTAVQEGEMLQEKLQGSVRE